MKRVLPALGLAILAASCGGNADPDPPAPAAEAGAARAADAADAASADAPVRAQARERAGGGNAGEMEGRRHQRRGEGHTARGGEGRGEGQGMRRGEGRGEGQGMGRGGGHDQGQGMGGGHGGMNRTVERPETPAELAEGERLFDAICAQCHTLDPPYDLAPPMSHVARHMARSLETEEAFRAHIRTFVPHPDADASVMPAHAVERFGLMPALPLPEPLLDQISAYVWWLHQVDSGAGGG